MSRANRFADEPLPHGGEEFLTALRGGKLDQSDRLLGDLPATLPDSLIAGVAELHMLRERWAEAEAALARLRRPAPEVPMRRRLCLNLASIRAQRPALYKIIADADASARYSIVESRLGPKTISYCPDASTGRKTILSADGDPTGSVAKILSTIQDAQKAGKTLALASIGDGYLLAELARHPPQLFLDRQQLVYVLEPDPHLLLACLMIHDYTGAEGPIEQDRFVWCVGEKWSQRLREQLLGDLYLTYPQLTLRMGLRADEIEKQLVEVLKELGALDRRLALRANSYYQHLSRDELVNVFGGKPYRRPRVMVVTSRFTTVLQHSARDVVDAMQQLGWETHLIIEPTPAHGINRLVMRDTLAQFRPDLVFQIDHLRSEWGDQMPANLPSVCWIQDHLPNLTSVAAGNSVQAREFVLIPSVQRYVKNYAYPSDNCLEFRKLTRLPKLPARWTSDGEDLVYVSNWSQQPHEVAAEVINSLAKIAPQSLIEECCRRMMAIYGAGGSLATPGDVRRVLEEAGPNSLDGQSKLTVITTLFERMNNVLYRQQGLAWAHDVAKRRGLTLAIYGNGWEGHPQFAAHARGYASYGGGLEELSRRAKVNLVLEPYVCVQHQRMLDCLAAGGFVLSRAYPQTDVVQSLIDDPDDPQALAESARNDASPDQFDPRQTLRALQNAGFLPESGAILPRLTETTFANESELEQRLDRLLSDHELRTSIAADQREAVNSRYSYVAGMKRMVAWIRDRIASEQIVMRCAG